MAFLVIELTNRCNLNCRHCLDGRNNADGDLDMAILDRIVQEASAQGYRHISLTGGEPTLHPEFSLIIEKIRNGGYTYGIVTNGWNFQESIHSLLPHLDRLSGVTFSLDGAGEDTHDRIRGRGSFRRLMGAISVCVLKNIPFTFNTLLTSNNVHELEKIAQLAQELRGESLRFGHLIATPRSVKHSLDLSPDQKKDIEARILRIQKEFDMPIFIAPGHYTANLFPCDPLQMREVNIDWRGNITLCCHLSGLRNHGSSDDIIGNMKSMTLSRACTLLSELNREFRVKKSQHFAGTAAADADNFPCWYCLNYFNKIEWLREFPENPWHDSIWMERVNRRVHK